MKISVFYEHILEAAQQSSKSILEICQLAASYGITGVEIENIRLLEIDNTALSVLKQADLEISCIYGFFDFSHNSNIKDGLQMVDLAKNVNSRKIMVIPGFVKGIERIPFIYQRKKEKMISALNIISAYANENGVMLVLEDFDDKIAPYSDAKGLKYFLDRVEGIKCAFDTGNFLYSEEDSCQVLPLFLSKIGHVHCKDRTFIKKEGEICKKTIKGREMYSCAVGSGCIKMKDIVEQIIQSGYDDYFAIEHFGSLCQLKDMKESAKWLQEF